MGRIGPNEVSGCPNRLPGAGGEPGCGGGGIWGRRRVGGEMQRCVAAGAEDGADAAQFPGRRSFRGGGVSGRAEVRGCVAAGNGDRAGAVLRGLRMGRVWRRFRGGDVSGAEARWRAGVRVGCPFRVICPEGALRGTLPYGAACAVRGRRGLCHGAEGRSGSGKENWTATGCSGAVSWPSGAIHRGRRATRRAAACRAGAKGRGACA